jgi:uncharacterized protein (DUF433 family)
VFRDTRMPVATVFENLEAGSPFEEIIEQFYATREQIPPFWNSRARSLDAPRTHEVTGGQAKKPLRAGHSTRPGICWAAGTP